MSVGEYGLLSYDLVIRGEAVIHHLLEVVELFQEGCTLRKKVFPSTFFGASDCHKYRTLFST